MRTLVRSSQFALAALCLLAPGAAMEAQAPACAHTALPRACAVGASVTAARGGAITEGMVQVTTVRHAAVDLPRTTVDQPVSLSVRRDSSDGTWRTVRRDAWRGCKWGALVGAVTAGAICAADHGCRQDGDASGPIFEQSVFGGAAGATFGLAIGALVGAIRTSR